MEADDIAWLMFYFGPGCGLKDPFTYSFTAQQREMIAAFRHGMTWGGDTARAASRGEGKTTIFERMLIKGTLTGEVDFTVLFAATGALAETSLNTIKAAIEENPLLAADYPEACIPVIALQNAPQRAHGQTVSGFRHDNGQPFEMHPSKFTWCGQKIVFPNVPGSPSARAIIVTRGLDSAVRGIKEQGRRVKLVGIDDPDTEETVRSPEQAAKLEDKIDRGIAGLGSQQFPVARVMLTTIQNRTCVSYKFTDPIQKPSWKGRRFRFLVSPPERHDLWEEYIALYHEDLQDTAFGRRDDPHCRRSHQFYLDNREAMEAGAVVANPNRFNPSELPDGTQVEVSALQHYYNRVARTSAEAVATELDNDPAEEAGPVESGITPHMVQRKVNGYARKAIPPDCAKLTRGIDCRKTALHWVIRAWKQDGTPYTIDYGVAEVQGTTYGTDEGLDLALIRAIHAYLEESAGEYERTIDRTLIDAGWRTEAIYEACRRAGPGVQPVMGVGKSQGCVQVNFTDVQKRTPSRKPGDRWFQSKKSGLWLVHADADHWKAWEHDRWMTGVGLPGCMTIFGERSADPKRLSADEKGHLSYAHHICNEIEVDDPEKGRRFKAKSPNTHWLDASYYADVAASIEGIKLYGAAKNRAAQSTEGRPTLRQLAGR